jgi:hypothetical protein
MKSLCATDKSRFCLVLQFFIKIFQRHRLRIIKSLCNITATLGKEVCLILCLHTFRYHIQPDCLRHPDRITYDLLPSALLSLRLKQKLCVINYIIYDRKMLSDFIKKAGTAFQSPEKLCLLIIVTGDALTRYPLVCYFLIFTFLALL